MESLALGALGLLFGVVFCIIAFSAYLLYQAAKKQQELSLAEAKRMGEIAQENFRAIDQLRLEVSAALTRLDATQLHDAATQIRRSSAKLARTVGMLYKLTLSQEGAGAILAEELEDELRQQNQSAARPSPYAGDMSVTGSAPELSPEDAKAYEEHLRQRAQEQLKRQAMAQDLPHLPDIQEAYEEEEKEAGVENPFAAGGF